MYLKRNKKILRKQKKGIASFNLLFVFECIFLIKLFVLSILISKKKKKMKKRIDRNKKVLCFQAYKSR